MSIWTRKEYKQRTFQFSLSRGLLTTGRLSCFPQLLYDSFLYCIFEDDTLYATRTVHFGIR